MNLLRRAWQTLLDPWWQGVLVLVAVAAAAFVMFGFGWRGVARTTYVPLQLPWLLSASFGGCALLGTALAAWSIHLGRRTDAVHRLAVEELTRDAAELADGLRTGRRALPKRHA